MARLLLRLRRECSSVVGPSRGGGLDYTFFCDRHRDVRHEAGDEIKT